MKPFLLLLALVSSALAQEYRFDTPPVRPDAKLTPGTIRPVTVDVLVATKTGTVRNVPASLKRHVFLSYFGVVPPHPGDFEIDHLISLELGGSNDQANLWPQSYHTTPYNSHVKDRLEDWMAASVRKTLKSHGSATATALLSQYQHEISSDWIAAYTKYLSHP